MSMRLAVMQPYLFPYIGYFQLIKAVDKFVIADDNRFIKSGWINRNRILLNGRGYLFSVPLVHPSYHRMIKDTMIHKESYPSFKAKFARQMREAYQRAPFFDVVSGMVHRTLDSEGESIGRLALNSLRLVCGYLGVDTAFVDSSAVYQNNHLPAQRRLLDICRREGAGVYINLSGGVELYQESAFAQNGIELVFIKPKPIEYRQFDNEFVPWLSIIDVLMFNSPEAVRSMLDQAALMRPSCATPLRTVHRPPAMPTRSTGRR